MGKPTVPPPTYRDDNAAAADDDVSLHTTRSDYTYDDAPELPSYSDSEHHAAVGTSILPQVGADDFQSLHAPRALTSGWKKSSHQTPAVAIGCETSIRMDQRLNDPNEMRRYIETYLQNVPPNPFVRVQGWHWEMHKRDNKKQQERVFDFDIVLSIRQHLPPLQEPWWVAGVVSNSAKAHRGTVFRIRAPGSKQDIEVGHDTDTRSLEEWCQDFCTSNSSLKIFRFSREVIGLDTQYITDELQNIIRSTHYRGHIDIDFPVADKNIDIYSPHWANRARIGWVRWIFYFTFLWIFTWPILFITTKKWAVYRAEWHWSYLNTDGATIQKRYWRLSEQQWVDRYRNLIKSLAWEKFQGDASDMPTNVDPEARRRGARTRLPSTGNANVDSAVSFIQDGVGVWNALNGRGESGDGGWGADER